MNARIGNIFLAVGLVSMSACSSSSPNATTQVDADPAPDDGKTTPNLDAGEEPTVDSTIVVHYPLAKGAAITLRGDAAPLDPNRDTTMTQQDATTLVAHVAIPKSVAHLKVTPYLDGTKPARGSGLEVKIGGKTDIYPHFLNQKGTVKKLFDAFHSTAMASGDPGNNDQVVWAYLPASYDENTTLRYPVVYMHDGQNLWVDANSTTGIAWHVDAQIDAAVEAGTIAEPIVIAPEHGPLRQQEYAPVADPGYPQSAVPGGPFYAQMVALELKPQVDAMLRTRPERENTVALGSSLGGLMSAYEGVLYPNVFGLLGEMSPSIWWDSDWIVFRVDESSGPRFSKIYVDQGTVAPDPSTNSPLIVAEYQSQGYGDDALLYYVEAGASHDEAAWGRRIPVALAFLLPPDRDLGSVPEPGK